MSEDNWADVADDWDLLIKERLPVWTGFHEWWLSGVHKPPMYVVRYEDLIEMPEAEMTKVLAYLLNQEPGSLEGSLVE